MCKFCNNSGDHRYTYSDNGVKYFVNLFGNRYLRIGIEDNTGLNFRRYPKIESMKINFCPFCGRDLNPNCNRMDEAAKK